MTTPLRAGDSHEAVETDLERRTQNFVRRDREYKTKIELLEAELAKAKSSATPTLADLEADKHMSKLRDLHGTIVTNIEHVQEQTARILQEQEKDLLRAFRARLFDLQTELEKEKSRAEDGAAVWIEKNRQLQKELDWAKEMADRLDRHNQALSRENVRLKNQFKTQEDDREYLIKQLVAAKKDNARLRQETNKAREEIGSLQAEIDDLRIKSAMGMHMDNTRTSAPGSPVQASSPAPPEERADSPAIPESAGLAAPDEARYRDVILRLKKLLDAERKAAKQARAQLAAEIAGRSEAEMFLRRAIEDAKVEIDKKRQAVLLSTLTSAPKGSTSPRSSSARRNKAASDIDGLVDMYTSLSKEDREQILASLLAQEHVLTALQRIAFPPRPSSADGDRPLPAEHGAVIKDPGFTPAETTRAAQTWADAAQANSAAVLEAKIAPIEEKAALRLKATSKDGVSPRPAPSPTGISSPDRFKTSTLGRAATNIVGSGTARPEAHTASRAHRPASRSPPPEPEMILSSHKMIQGMMGFQTAKAPISPAPGRGSSSGHR